MRVIKMSLKKVLLLLFLFTGLSYQSFSQSGTEFWFAPPDITDLHNSPGGEPLYLYVSSNGQPATVTVSQPANSGFNGGSPIVVNVQANKSVRINLTPFKSVLETRPTNTVCNTGLRVVSTSSITCYYECANTNNTDIWALKGPNSLGTEFYIPLHKHAPFYNHGFASPHYAFASFDICATQNNTQVTIYSPTPIDGYPALSQFTITLNQGQTYSCGWTGVNYHLPSTHPSGAVVLADKNITVSIKDDSNHNPSGSCYDIMGDQIVPVDVLGNDYVAVKGSLNNTGDESMFIMATQNNTKVYVDGSNTPAATLFAGESYRVDMDYLAGNPTSNSLYVSTSKPSYAMHVTGFGCEMGMAQLPPLNCAGSQALNFTRSSSENFYITLLCRTAAINAFTITGSGTAAINAASFVTVPGTDGEWQAARITYNTTQVPVDSTFRVTNSVDVFALGIGNGGASSGCRYGYFSEFVAPISVNAGIDQTICANTTATLSGLIAGGTTTGEWTTSGSGTFTPSNTALDAVYTPSAGDAAVGYVTLTLTSTGACIPVSDQMLLTITPAPVPNAGADVTRCRNNAQVELSGTMANATGGVWTGGNGTYIPGNNVLTTVYTPTTAEVSSGSLILTLTSTGNGLCLPVSDNVIITFSPSPTVNAGPNQTKCSNNAATTLAGSVTVATGGVWSGGGGSFSPSNTALNPIYTPTETEITNGSVTLTLTTTGNGLCNAVNDDMTIFFTTSPQADAGVNQTKCANNAVTQLAGTFSIATGVQWTGGLGIFNPNSATATATYTPTTTEINNGSVTLTITTTGNGNCVAATDQMTIYFSSAPTANAGNDITICANNPVATLNGSYTIATGAVWSGGNGTYSPNNTVMNATYTPTPAEIAAGSVTLTLTSTGNNNCIAVSDAVVINIIASPIANAGADITACANNTTTSLSGQIFGATGGVWSGGNGTFFPNNAILNATYTPTETEVASGMVTLTLTSTGNGSCNAVTDQVVISYLPAPVVNAGIDQTKCANNATVQLNGFVNNSTGGQWTGGLGIYTPSANALNATYAPTATELAQGYVVLTLTSTGNGSCLAVTDEVTISFTPAPVANAGSDLSSCANNPQVQLNGTFTVATGALWSGGSGSYAPSGVDMNAVYTPSAAEITAGTATLTLTTTGNGTCLPESDNVVITIAASPVVNAGADQVVCVNNLNVALSGSIVGITNSGIWTTTGTGAFLPNNTSLNATYILSAADSTAGGVTLTLTSTNNGTCIAVADQMNISVLPAGTANAGSDISVCGNNAYVNLNGSVGGGATSGVWSTTGTGVFTPSNATLNATYIPSPFDIANGTVTLSLTANSCNTAVDGLIVTITPAPEVYAGDDQTVCSSQSEIELNGTLGGSATTAIWTTNGTGTFSPSATTLNATYTPSTADVNNQQIYFVLTSSNNGNCLAAADTVHINIYPTGAVNAGADQMICSNNPNVTLNGAVSGGATEAIWSTSGSGLFIPNAQTLAATYVPSAADIIAGNVNLLLTATNSCNTAIDFMNVVFTPAPVVNAGEDQFTCGLNPSINLNGSVTNAAGAVWSGGAGSFAPSNTALNAIYMPSASEQAAGFVTLTLTSTGNGLCNAEVDQVVIHFSTGVVVNAGVDQTVCNTSTQTVLQGSVSNGSTTGVWSTLGSGTFLPDPMALNAIYEFSSADIAAGSVTLVLTSTNNGICPASNDAMTITFGNAAFAYAGADQNICASFTEINLNGLIGGGATQGVWSTNGFGTFTPNNTTLQTTYNIHAGDIAVGSVTFTLNTTDHGVCLQGTDEVTFTISQSSSVNAGANISVCGNNLTVPLGGNISGASNTGVWSTLGSGYFTPSNTELNAQYIASANDSLAGSVSLVLTSTNTGLCPLATDTLNITIEKPATVYAGSDISICVEASSIALNGSVTSGSQAGVWSTTGSGSFTPDNQTLSASYIPSQSDINLGNVSLILSSTSSGICPIATDTLHVSFSSLSVVNAGADIAICGIGSPVLLNGNVSGPSTTGAWSTLGSGTFAPDNQTLNASYQPSLNDSLAGSVQLVLVSTNTGLCAPSSDTITITINAPAQVNAGADQTICASQSSVSLNGIISGGTQTGVWTTTGSGTFSPSNSALSVTYTPSSSDVLNGQINIILTSTGNGVCNAVQDEVVITFIPSQSVNAGNNRILCENVTELELGGIITGENATGIWTTTGTGTFSPNATTLNAVYHFSNSDVSAGELLFILTPTGNVLCPAQADTFTVNMVAAPIAAFNATAGDSLNVSFTDESIGAGTWFWDFGVGGTSTAQHPTYTYPESGSYDVTLIVTAAGGCADTAFATIRVLGDDVKPIAIPTGFSPNNDGSNDELRVLGGPFVEVDFRVYNGWGNLIFSTTDPNVGWDGTYKGEPQPGGVYVYTATGVTVKGRHIKASGSVTLIR